MSIKKRGETWWVDISAPSGERIRRSAKTSDRKAAQEYHDKLKVQLWRQHQLGEAPARTFEEAAVRFLKQCTGQADFSTKVRHIAYWRDKFAGWDLPAITADAVAESLPTHRTQPGKSASPLAPATMNRYMATIRAMLNAAVLWGWLTHAPKLVDRDEPSKRIRWITRPQAARLIRSITQPWLRDVAGFALATGARAGEVLGLKWEQVDLQRQVAWLECDETKSGRARSVPLNADAVEVLLVRQRECRAGLVFRRNGSAIPKVDNRMFKAACLESCILDFRFHDLRHTWASWHVQAGTPLLVLKELGGWETIEMVQRYAHLGRSHLAEHANRVTFTAQGIEDEAGKTKETPGRASLVA